MPRPSLLESAGKGGGVDGAPGQGFGGGGEGSGQLRDDRPGLGAWLAGEGGSLLKNKPEERLVLTQKPVIKYETSKKAKSCHYQCKVVFCYNCSTY